MSFNFWENNQTEFMFGKKVLSKLHELTRSKRNYKNYFYKYMNNNIITWIGLQELNKIYKNQGFLLPANFPDD
jgi:hypothetical protein